MQETLNSLATYGYIFLFFYSLGGGFVGLVAASVLSYAGKMDITLAIIIASVANFLGDMGLFYLARYQKNEVMRSLIKQRRKLALSHLWMRRYGDVVIFIQKYIYGIKTLIPIAIGFSKYNLWRFCFYNILASVLWGLVIGLGGYVSGELFIRLFEAIAEHPYLMPLLMLGLLGGLWLWMGRVSKKK
ncbi:MAG: DedA family protein [Wolinella sp.]